MVTGPAGQLLPSLRVRQDDWLENIVGHAATHSHQGETALTADLLLQVGDTQSELGLAQAVGEHERAATLLQISQSDGD